MQTLATAYNYDKKLRNILKDDWQALLPGMKPLKGFGVGFFKICGPLLIMCGVKFSNESLNYGPGFGICNLMYAAEYITPLNLRIDLITHGNANYNGYKLYKIDPPQHKELYQAAFAALNAATYGFLQDRDCTLSEIIAAFKDFIQKSAGKFINQELVTLPLLAAWAGKTDLAHELLLWCHEQAKVVHANFSDSDLISKPQHLQDMVHNFIIKHNLKDLPCRQLIID